MTDLDALIDEARGQNFGNHDYTGQLIRRLIAALRLEHETCRALGACAKAYLERADALEQRVRDAELVIAIARTINRGPFEDIRMTGVLKAYDAALTPSRHHTPPVTTEGTPP